MASGRKHRRRGVVGSLAFAVLYYWATFRWIGSVGATPFFYPTSQYYYGSDSRIRPTANGYSTYQQPNTANIPSAAESQNVAYYTGNPNYYGVPGYEDHRSASSSRNGWRDPYLGWKWNNYYNRYYYNGYPSSADGGLNGWKNRNDGSTYYYNRRQDAVQPPLETTIPATTTTTQRPRKKKLFVPNVWG
ncbi:uncharacterized protein LOC126560998 [Anopheles maculipalpis]|uniref:uncharacterized protein LOC126560998 n=1 Tax=Anopheles maculipalpis TaxID=1496333 RepID=UPI0021591941|nr:uncharacterized protein LOC126560998 [Anopheles maculipalpis]